MDSPLHLEGLTLRMLYVSGQLRGSRAIPDLVVRILLALETAVESQNTCLWKGENKQLIHNRKMDWRFSWKDQNWSWYPKSAVFCFAEECSWASRHCRALSNWPLPWPGSLAWDLCGTLGWTPDAQQWARGDAGELIQTNHRGAAVSWVSPQY